MIAYKVEHICSYSVTLASPPEVIGPVAEGIRANFYVTGGEVSGPKLKGKVRPVGADWLIVRRDGVAILDVRTTLETLDGAVILVMYSGVMDLGGSGYDNFARGEFPPRPQIRMTPRFTTSHPGYLWLNRIHCFGVGEANLAANEVAYDIYSVR